jgi:hypothetical protein
MTTWKTILAVLAGGLAAMLVLSAALPAADPPAPSEGALVVIDGAGKEQKLKSWKFVLGTRRLSWLAPAPAKDGDDKEPPEGNRKAAPAGPEALAFRDEHSTSPPLLVGVLTLVPLDRLRAVEYDDANGVTVRVATGDKPDAEEALTGTTKYQGINKLTIEAEVDKGDLGVAEVKYLGGVRNGIRGLRFPAAKGAPAKEGRPATVTTGEKQKYTDKVLDLQPLYEFADKREVLLPTLMFKKTLKLDVGKVHKLRAAGEGKEAEGPEWGVTLKGGEEETLTLLEKVTLDGKPAVLQGLVGRVPVGYRLYPVQTIAEVVFDGE